MTPAHEIGEGPSCPYCGHRMVLTIRGEWDCPECRTTLTPRELVDEKVAVAR